jgi:nucleoside diphosphate kinase
MLRARSVPRKSVYADWHETSFVKYLTLVIVLPTGVAATSADDINTKVQEDGLALMAKAMWPDLASSSDELHDFEGNHDDNFFIRKNDLAKALHAEKEKHE